MHARFLPGVSFSAKTLLEIAIVLLGASINVATIGSAGFTLMGVVFGVVIASLLIGYVIGRLLGLSDGLATLIACGNSICGNSAIVAAAPVIRAKPEEVAASIAFTAALGIIVVLLLPAVPQLIGLNEYQYGILAGMSVYAVPQVLAATAPVGVLSVQIGAMVKMMRVMMLGPVILLLGGKEGLDGQKVKLRHLVPWFILGFLAAMTARSLSLIPESVLPVLKETSGILTLIAMAALGLSVNIVSVLSSGGRVLAAGTLSLLALLSISLVLLLNFPLAGA
jgi:uncharacterized integral membrane protein (TIGR00698 family)